MNTQPLLAVKCLVYNHEPYLCDCLNGFVMQKTTFPFICIVHDDASTDNSAKIIREYAEKYPDIIKPIYETENQYSKNDGSLTKVINDAIPDNVKYIAICEGDDYWIDPNKLQMQVNIMEKKNIGFSYTYSLKKKGNNKKLMKRKNNSFSSMLKSYSVPAQTMVFRYDGYKQYLKECSPENKKWMMGDFPLALWFSVNSKVLQIKKVTAIYRILNISANHQASLEKAKIFLKSSMDVKLFFVRKYNLPFSEEYINNLFLYSLAHKAYYFHDYEEMKKICNKMNFFSAKAFILKLVSKVL